MRESATLPLLLKALRLSTMAKLWEEVLEQAKNKGWSPAHYLATLCDHELAERENRRLTRRIKESNLPRGKSLETYDFKVVPSLDKSQVMSLSTGDYWIEEGHNVLLFGPSGVGKTHLVAGIGERLVMSGYRVLFTRTTTLLQKLQAAKRASTLPAQLSKLDKYDCLILDDFGYVKKNEQETDLLFELICERYERRSLMITCNQPFGDWDRIFDDKRTAIAAVDRLVHRATLLENFRRKAIEDEQLKSN